MLTCIICTQYKKYAERSAIVSDFIHQMNIDEFDECVDFETIVPFCVGERVAARDSDEEFCGVVAAVYEIDAYMADYDVDFDNGMRLRVSHQELNVA
jgi:hypothetical protein